MDSIEHLGFSINFNAKAEKALATIAAETGFANPEAFAYLLDYGFRQALSDRIAGMRKKLEGEKDEAGNAKHSEADIEALIQSALDKRYSDILAGSVGSRSTGPRLKPLDKLAFEAGVSQLRLVYGKLKKQWPSGEGSAETIRLAVAALWEKEPRFKAKAYADAQASLDAEAALMAGFDASSLGL